MKLARKQASRTVLAVVFILGCIPSALSSSTFKEIRLLNRDIFDFYDYFSGNILFVLTAFFMTIFVGWVIPKDALAELQSSEKNPNSLWVKSWFFLIRYIIPIIIFIIFIKGLNDNLA